MKVAAIQMVSSDAVEENLQQAGELLEEAARQGARLAVLPETFACFAANQQQALARQEREQQTLSTFLADRARQWGIYVVGGTIPVFSDPAATAPCAVSMLFSPGGMRLASYEKIHLFDVEVGDSQGSYRESDTYRAGHSPVSVALGEARPWVLGLSVCYDLRFPELYRLYQSQGCNLLTVPAAFTRTTGEAHWELLLRARAVENQCFVIGANQGGQHTAKRATSGGSCIVDPWGEVLAKVDRGPGVAVAELDYRRLVEIRQRMPIAEHRRFWVEKEI